MSERKERIAELYFRSNSVQTEGNYKISAHRDNPDLPDSPWYMHYPLPGEPGSELLPDMFELIGLEFYDICESQETTIRPSRITGHPNGAIPLGLSWAKRYVAFPENIIEFEKFQQLDGKTDYKFRGGEYETGEELGIAEDHVSSARNNRLFVAHVRKIGFTVMNLLAVVDRQQGAKENLASEGVTLLSILTADELLQFGLAERYITKTKFDEIQEYRAINQFI